MAEEANKINKVKHLGYGLRYEIKEAHSSDNFPNRYYISLYFKSIEIKRVGNYYRHGFTNQIKTQYYQTEQDAELALNDLT